MGPRAGLDGRGKSRPHRDSIPDRPARSQSLYRLSYPARSIDSKLYYQLQQKLLAANMVQTTLFMNVKIYRLNKGAQIPKWQV